MPALRPSQDASHGSRAEAGSPRMRSPRRAGSRNGGKIRRGLEQDKAAQEAKFRQIQEQIQRDTQRALQEKAKKREAAFNEMFKKVSDGLNGTDPLIKKIDNKIEYTETMRHKKKVMLYEEWRECVYDRIHSQLQRKLSERTSRSIENRLRARYDDFISTSNKKGAVFRDIITEKEYNPMAVRSDVIRFDSTIDDPVLQNTERHPTRSSVNLDQYKLPDLSGDGSSQSFLQTVSGSSRRLVTHPGGESTQKMNGAIYHRNVSHDAADSGQRNADGLPCACSLA